MRESDPSIITTNIASAPNDSDMDAQDVEKTGNPNVEANMDMDNDPFASYLNSESDPSIAPKILITTSPKASKNTYDLCDELVGLFPGAEFIRRKKGKGYEIGVIAGWAVKREYGAMIVVNEDMKKPSMSQSFMTLEVLTHVIDGMTLVHLPNGPTAYFKLTSIELTKQIFVWCLLFLLFDSY
jgi:ribosome production factor 1